MISIQSILNRLSSMSRRTGLFSIKKDEFFETLTDITNKVKEVNENVNSVSKQLIWQAPVANFAALATTYPNVQQGWASLVLDQGYIYAYNSAYWVNTGLREFPKNVALLSDVNVKLDVRPLKNLLDLLNIRKGFGIYANGDISDYNAGWANTYAVSNPIFFNENQSIVCNCSAHADGFVHVIYNEYGIKLATVSSAVVTNVTGGVYALLTIKQSIKFPQIEYGTTNTEFENYNPLSGYILNDKVFELNAYATGSNDDTEINFYGYKNGKCAIQRAIDICDPTRKYVINCFGHFEQYNPEEYFLGSNGLFRYIVEIPASKKNITLQGQGFEKTSIKGSLQNNLGSSFPYMNYIVLENTGENCFVNDIYVDGYSNRYPVHVDVSSLATGNNHNIKFKGCKVHHRTNQGDATSIASNVPVGLGISSGMSLELNACELIAGSGFPLYVHDNLNFSRPFLFTIKNSKLISQTTDSPDSIDNHPLLNVQLMDSGVNSLIELFDNDYSNNRLILVSTIRTTAGMILSDFKANMYCRMKGNVPPMHYWNQSDKGKVLRIKSTVGAIRIDTTSSAFSRIVAGSSVTNYNDVNGVVHDSGYRYFDGTGQLKSWACGELCVDPSTISSMQSRLGNCTSSPLSLKVIINSVEYTITFNQNYTSYSDAQMLAVINNALSGQAVADLYCLGWDYYPEFTSTETHRANENLLTGMGVKIGINGITASVSDADVDGILLDDVKNGDYGRVARNGLFRTLNDYRFFIKTDFQNAYAAGTKFSISNVPGVFTQSEDGKFVAKYYSTVEIA